ncbi:MAG: YegS/Rv2252/BmrU family lipid kinase [Eubacteriales bacterium]|nr:YegS/Rv2252/BmrU family lipid kinase [Eubacteriales bacterium]
MQKALLIYNPRSGLRQVPKKLDNILEKFMNEGILVQPFRLNKNSGIELSEVIEPGKYSFLMLSGGDGTISLGANLLFKNDLCIPMGIIPSGTCNDTARSLGIPENLDKAVDVILNGNTVSVDTGLINDDIYFLNSCAGGTFAQVSYNTNDDVKKNIGALAYYLKGLSEFPNVKPFKIKMTTDDSVLEEEIMLFLILNGRHVAGLNNVISRAKMTDGLMDIILIKKCYPIELAGVAFNVLNDTLVKDKNVIQLTTRYCKIESDADIYVSVDGEKTAHLPISISFINKNLDVFAPHSIK